MERAKVQNTALMSDHLDATTWWDCEEGSPNGAARLMTRCHYVWHWSPQFCQRVLMGYKDFLELKQEANDYDGNIIIPSAAILQMWQQHILDTYHYEQDCVLLVGRKVEYPVDYNDDDDARAKNKRIADTRSRTCKKKQCQPMDLDKEVWAYAPPPKIKLPASVATRRDKIPDATIAIQWKSSNEKDSTAEFKIAQSMRLDRIFQAYAKQRGLDRSSLTFLLRSQQNHIEDENCNPSIQRTLGGSETLLQLFSGKITEMNDISVWIDCEPSRWEC